MSGHLIFSSAEVEEHIRRWKELATLNGEEWLKSESEIADLKAKLAKTTEELEVANVVKQHAQADFVRVRDERDKVRHTLTQVEMQRDSYCQYGSEEIKKLEQDNRAKTVRIDQLLAARDADRATFGVFNPNVTTPVRWRDARKEGFDAGVAWQRKQHEPKFLARAVEVGDLREENDQLKEDLREVTQLRADLEHEREAFKQLSVVVQNLRKELSRQPINPSLIELKNERITTLREELSSWRTRAELAERTLATVGPVLEAARKVRDYFWPTQTDYVARTNQREWIGCAKVPFTQLCKILSPLSDTVAALEDSLR
jgi:chromosome segregation ATPase